MATNVLTGIRTMAEAAKSIGAHGNELAVVDVLSQRTPMLQEGHWEEANDFNSHHYLQTLTEIQGTDTVINVEVSWEEPTMKPVTEIIQGIESYSKADSRIVRMQNNAEQYRRTRDNLRIKQLGKAVQDRMLYGNSTTGLTTSVNPAQVTGIIPRFSKISGVTYNQLVGTQYWPLNVVSAGGSTANSQASALAIKWGPDGVYFTYPRGGKNFIQAEDVSARYGGPILITSSTGAYEAEISHFSLSFGIAVADWRAVQRICNINKATDTKPWTSTLQVQLLAAFPDADWTNVVLYVNITTWTEMLQEALSNTNSFHFDDAPWGGSPTVYFQTIPVRLCDRMVNTEPVVA